MKRSHRTRRPRFLTLLAISISVAAIIFVLPRLASPRLWEGSLAEVGSRVGGILALLLLVGLGWAVFLKRDLDKEERERLTRTPHPPRPPKHRHRRGS